MPVPSVTATSYTTSIKLYVTNAQSGDQLTLWFYKSNANLDTLGDPIRYAYDFSNENPYTIDGLTASTIYVYNIRLTRGEDVSFSEKHRVDTLANPTPPTPTKPDKWSWGNEVVQNQPISNLKATTWNNFTTHINDVREYKNKTKWTFDIKASSGGVITADIVNQAVNAINDMGKSLSKAEKDKTNITAAFFTGMSNAIDSYL